MQTHEIYAKNLGDTVYIRPFVLDHEGNYVYLDGVPYNSPAEFAYSIMADANKPESERYVCAALMQYGASAQIYFNYRTDKLVSTAPAKYPNVKLSDYDLAYRAEYLDSLNTDAHVRALAATLGQAENAIVDKVNIKYNMSTLNLAGAIRLSAGFNIDEAALGLGENNANVAKAEVLFWNERDMAALDSLTYEPGNYAYKCDLKKATGEETVYIGEYRGQSDHIRAKYMGDTVYFTCRIELKDGTVYYSGLGYYSPEAFAGDHIKNSAGTIVDVSKSIIVYSEMAYNCFILGK